MAIPILKKSVIGKKAFKIYEEFFLSSSTFYYDFEVSSNTYEI